jgi:hypothetical protein
LQWQWFFFLDGRQERTGMRSEYQDLRECTSSP